MNDWTYIWHFLATIGTKPVNSAATNVLQQFSMTARAVTHILIICVAKFQIYKI